MTPISFSLRPPLRFIIGLILFVFQQRTSAQDDSLPRRRIRAIHIEGNAVTPDKIITRELLFKVGDSLSVKALLDSKQKLLNTSLFNYVTVSADSTGIVNVEVKERWYLAPSPCSLYMNKISIQGGSNGT